MGGVVNMKQYVSVWLTVYGLADGRHVVKNNYYGMWLLFVCCMVCVRWCRFVVRSDFFGWGVCV